jgi:hypothetical protein
MPRQKPARNATTIKSSGRVDEETRADILALLEHQRAARAKENAQNRELDVLSAAGTLTSSTASTVGKAAEDPPFERKRKLSNSKKQPEPQLLRLLKQRESRGHIATQKLASVLAPRRFNSRAVERSQAAIAGDRRPFLVTNSSTRLIVDGFCCHDYLPLILITFKGAPCAYLFRSNHVTGGELLAHEIEPGAVSSPC